MRRNYTYKFYCIILIACAIPVHIALAQQKADTGFLSKSKLIAPKSPFHNNLHLAMPPLRPAATSSQKLSVVKPDDKVLEDVQVFPNPVTDQVNIKYQLSRNAVVTVKVVDVLGNDLITLVSQRVESGEQTFSYSLANKLHQGFYFIRVVAGTESVIKRFSVL